MQRIAIALCAAVLAGAGGLAISKAGESKVGTATAATQPPGGPGAGGPGGGAPGFSGLADDLGVSKAKLQQAMQTARPDRTGSPQDMAANLAEALDLPTATVQKALEANRPSGTMPPGGAPG
jgi:hypothetical protein